MPFCRAFSVAFFAVMTSAVAQGVSSWRPIPFTASSWRPLLSGEVCPQGHVETFEDSRDGRQWKRPQVEGRDVPCGLAKHVAGIWAPLDASEHCQSGFVEILLPSGAQRVTEGGQEVRCAVVRAP